MFDAGPRLHWNTHAHAYQRQAAEHLWNSKIAALWLDPGYGKTTIVLHAFKALLDAGHASNMLIVAPLRVVQTVWAQEIENWASLHGLRAARLHGPKKENQLKRRDVNVWLINYEGAEWLARMAKAGKIKTRFDVVVADEIRRLKTHTAHRFKMLRPIFAVADYRWGLTGTPASNGLMDLFGQFLILDGGAALGRTITRYRREYFEQGFDGWTWEPRPGAREQIEERISSYVFRTHGHLDLPAFVYDNRTITLDDKARAAYTRLKNDMVAQLEGQTITAANAAVLVGKLKQMANGRIYDGDRTVHEIHNAKAAALQELVEELGDEQLLIAYEFNHDLAQIREALGDDIPYLGAGVSEKTALEHVDAWNRREIRVMAAHPASAGHGLNLQKGGAHHILWWGPTFDLDHYIQFNDRLRRQGNDASAVIVHTFVTEKSVDEVAIAARTEKATLQEAILSALTIETTTSKLTDTKKESNTMTTLQFKPDAGQAAPQTGNPFSAPQAAPQAGNPFDGGQQGAPAPQGNPFGGDQQAAPQAAAIQQDVAAPPAPTPNQVLAAHGIALGAEQPMRDQAPSPDQSGGFGFQPAQPAAQTPPPFPGQGGTGFDSQPAQPDTVPDAEIVPEGPAAAAAEVAQTASAPVEGMVPLYTMIPADKLDKVLSAIGRAVK